MKTINNQPLTQDSSPLFLQLFFKDYLKIKLSFEAKNFEELTESIETLVSSASAYGFRRLNTLCGELLERCDDLINWNNLKPAMVKLDSYFYGLEKNYPQVANQKVC